MRAAALVLLAAGVLGAAAQLGGALPGVPQQATALGAPWLVAAFAAGALLRRPWRAAAGGAVLLAAGTIAYYVVRVGATGGDPSRALAAIAVAWAAAALAVGALMGVARRALALGPRRVAHRRRPGRRAGRARRWRSRPSGAAASPPRCCWRSSRSPASRSPRARGAARPSCPRRPSPRCSPSPLR